MLRQAGVGGDVNVPCNLLTLLMLRHAGVGGMLTFHVSMGVSVAQRVIESECNVETSGSAKMTKKSAAREQAVRPVSWIRVPALACRRPSGPGRLWPGAFVRLPCSCPLLFSP